MHPLNKHKYFGTSGLAVSFYNGSSVVSGYITKQTGTNNFIVTDGTNVARVSLAQTTAIATTLSSNPTYCTMVAYPYNATATGGTFTVNYGVDTATVAGTYNNFNVSDVLSLPSGSGQLTVATVSGSAIATVTASTAGSYTSLFSSPTTGTRAAGSGGSFTAHYSVAPSTGSDGPVIVGGGSGSSAGYHIADVITLTGTGSATIIVDTVDGGGGILTFHTSAVGTVTALPSNPVSTTVAPSGGTGATFTLKWHLLSVASSGGTGYNVGDTLTFNSLVATTAPTAHISVATAHAATTVVVDTPGVGITTAASSVTGNVTTATFNIQYHVATISSSGGSGYVVNDQIYFGGLVALTTPPTAHISTATSGAATATTVDVAGAGITVAATTVGVTGPKEYVTDIYATKNSNDSRE